MIDFHVHEPSRTGPQALWPYKASDYADYAASVGIERSVVFTFDGLLRPSAGHNDSVAAFAGEAPGRYEHFATVDPRSPDAADELERCLTELGAKGLKLHPWLQGFHSHGSFLDPVCEVAAAHRAPILLHDGTPPYSAPLQIAALARRHTRATLVLGHGGLHDLWREAVVAVQETPNLLVCMCATPTYAMREIVALCPLERILFGTDGGLAPSPRQLYVAARVRQLERLGLTPEQHHAIVHDNPARILAEVR
jgi:uncharacterized protein